MKNICWTSERALSTRDVEALARLLENIERRLRSHDFPEDAAFQELNAIFARLWAAGYKDYARIRESVGKYFWQSPQIRRCYEKPRGYAGDYLMMDFICKRHPMAETPLGRWIDGWFREEFPGTQSVRNRCQHMADLLAAEHRRGACRVLSVACGGAPELERFPRSIGFDEFVLLDQDEAALEFALQSVKEARGAAMHSLRLRPVRARIESLVAGTGFLGPRPFDLIYSMGLYDYLNDQKARVLTEALWRSLAPGGLLVIGNFQGNHWARLVVEAIMDWWLVYRSEKELQMLEARLPAASSTVRTDSTGLLNILEIRKAAKGNGEDRAWDSAFQ